MANYRPKCGLFYYTPFFSISQAAQPQKETWPPAKRLTLSWGGFKNRVLLVGGSFKSLFLLYSMAKRKGGLTWEQAF